MADTRLILQEKNELERALYAV